MDSADVTDMLRAARGSDALMPFLYEDLRRLAQARFADGPSQRSLNTAEVSRAISLATYHAALALSARRFIALETQVRNRTGWCIG